MNIIELLQKIGVDNIRLQMLDTSLTNMQALRRANKYTFESEVPFDLNGPEKKGIVLWLDRNEVAKAMAEGPTPTVDPARDALRRLMGEIDRVVIDEETYRLAAEHARQVLNETP